MLLDEDDLCPLEEEPDGLAEDEDEDECEEDEGTAGVAPSTFGQHPGWQE